MDRCEAHVAVVIRFKNEAAFLPAVLAAVGEQKIPGVSVRTVGVDNGSSDGSRLIAERSCDQVLEIHDYMPGAAINVAMREIRCDFACILSAHALPSSDLWLQALLREARKPDTLGVYGAQLYQVNSRFLDKRDLDIFSTRNPRIEVWDSDFWNANSMFPRSSWETAPFDERVFELEDHYWTKCQLNGHNCVRFVPDALVYHYSHIDRNDRVFLGLTSETTIKTIDRAINVLNDPAAGWPETMMAALTIKSLNREPQARAAIPSLSRHLAEHEDFDVRWRAAGTLGKLPDSNAVDTLITALSDPSFYARDEAAWALAELGPFAAPRLLARLDTIPVREWPLAALALGRSGHPDARRKAIQLIEQGLQETAGTLKRNYAYAAGELDVGGDLSCLAVQLNRLLESPAHDLRAVGTWAVGSLGALLGHDADWKTVRVMAASDPDPLVRAEAVTALGKSLLHEGNSASQNSLRRAMSDTSSRVRYVAVQSARLLAACHALSLSLDIPPDDPDFGVRFERDLLEMTLSERHLQRAMGHAL